VGLIALLLWCHTHGAEQASPGLRMTIAPLPVTQDVGPEFLLGQEQGHKDGTRYLWADFVVEGRATRYRVYFDRRDAQDFHFLDRKDQELTLGLCERGVEQILARAHVEDGASQVLRIARHGSQIGIFCRGALLSSAFDDRLEGGTAGWRRLGGEGELTVKAEAREDVHFTDEFMREDNKLSNWRVCAAGSDQGEFQIKNLRHPLLSANAFSYMGCGQNVFSTIERPGAATWDNYRLEASLRGPVAGTIGLVFAWRDEKNYGLFRWTARPLDAKGTATALGRREIVLVKDGAPEVLATAEGGYLPDQWYKAKVLLTYTRTQVSIDGHPLFELSHPLLTAGSAGVWCDVPKPKKPQIDPKAQPFSRNGLWELMREHAVFDDVKVDRIENIEDDFRRVGPLANGWLVGAGEWVVETPQAGECGILHVHPGALGSKSLIGDRRWAQYELDVEVNPGGGAAGLVFLHRDESNFLAARLDGTSLELVRVAQGQETVVDKVDVKRSAGYVPLKVSVQNGYVKVACAGATVAGFEDAMGLRGRAGLTVSPRRENTPARFRRFRVGFLHEADPLVTTNAIFEDEQSMQDWTSPTSEWYPASKEKLVAVEGHPVTLWWHRSQFPGDVELAVEPRDLVSPQHDIALSVGKNGEGRNNGYIFRYLAGRPGEHGKTSTKLELLRQGQVVEEKILSENVRELTSVALRRAGPFVIGKLNGQPAMVWRDEHPIKGSKVAYYSKGVDVKVESAKITSDHFRNELFSSAATEWRTAGSAIAEVSNRWQCDPRWSFFSLKNDMNAPEQGKAAVLWSKRLYPGDVTVEFFVGNKMESERGKPYTYARDINVTLCSDGSDLTKGYTFMFGGNGNRNTVITRQGKTVKESPLTIPLDMNLHRHWFAIRIEKRGNRLSYRVDRYFATDAYRQPDGELVFVDEQPVQGDRIALWTYEHALVISRVRISGDGGLVAEDPCALRAPLKTPYDP